MSNQTIRLRLGDCIERLQELPEGSVGALVCDPPYGLEFLGEDWERLGENVPRSVKNFKGFGGALKLPKYSSTSRYSSPNRTCSECGGMERGTRRRCSCERPHEHWKPIGKRRKLPADTPPNVTGGGMFDQLRTIGRWHQVWLKEAVRVLRSGGVAKVFSGVRTFHRLAQAMEMAGLEIIRIEAWTYGSGWPKSLDVARALDHTLGVEREEKTPPVTEIAQRYDDYGTALKSCWEPFLVGRKR